MKKAAESGNVFRKPLEQTKSLQPIWYWLLVLTALLVFLQVAVRRIAVDPIKVSAGARDLWNRLRGRATVAEKVPEYFERLRSRKAEADEEIRAPPGALKGKSWRQTCRPSRGGAIGASTPPSASPVPNRNSLLRKSRSR